jgi:hypothetical protein
MSNSLLIRHEKTGKRQELKIDYAAILKGRQPDFEIYPDDILFVPGSKAKTLAYGLLGQIPASVQQSVDR